MTRRRLTAGLLLVTSLLMLFPISMQVVAPAAVQNAEGKDASEPFPCQTRTCGCRSAKQCWKKCCCFSNAQKVAWAKANGVQPPAFVLAAAQREASVVTSATPAGETCCSKPATTSRQTDVPSMVPHTQSRVRLVIGVDVLQCQGVEQTLSGQLISLQPPPLMTLVISIVGNCEVVQLGSLPLVPGKEKPPTPPPRQRTV